MFLSVFTQDNGRALFLSQSTTDAGPDVYFSKSLCS